MNLEQSRRVVIAGAGLGGTSTAIRLLQFAREPVQIVLVERRAEYRHAGVAHHRHSNHWHHAFNIQAGRMAVFREDVDDFVHWANHEADRSDWPPGWREFTFTESGPAPRRIYPDYLADRLAQAAREAVEGVVLIQADGEVVDLDVHSTHVDVVVSNLALPAGAPVYERATIPADHVVLATGLERKQPAFAAKVVDHPAFVASSYSEDGLARIGSVRRDAVVAIVGTLLSAYDSATLLLRGGHTGKIHMISRSGLTLRIYPADHRHHVITLPPPRLADEVYAGHEDFFRRFNEELEQACAAVIRDHPEISPAVVTERVIKSWEPHLPAILARLPTADLRAVLDRHGSLLAMLRVGVMAYTAEIVNAAMVDGGQITVTAGRVEDIAATGTGSLIVSVAGTEPPGDVAIEADLVISNFGRESDYERVESPLWRNLLRRGTATAHARTGRGVEVDACGHLVDATGRPSPALSAVGSPREGDEITRNGRTGAFSFNLAAIKNHSVEVAAAVLCRLESCYDEAGAAVAGVADAELDKALARSVALDVRRMTARRRDLRDAVTARLEDSLRSVGELAGRRGGTAVTDRAVRYAVTSAATTRLKDLSVTPRDLRTLLGLGHHAGF